MVGIEGIGEAVTGGMLARAVERARARGAVGGARSRLRLTDGRDRAAHRLQAAAYVVLGGRPVAHRDPHDGADGPKAAIDQAACIGPLALDARPAISAPTRSGLPVG